MKLRIMCGITGIYSLRGNLKSGDIKTMTDSLRHRGPDDEGYLGLDFQSGKVYSLTGGESQIQGQNIETFKDPVNLLLGHRRLSIIDLSPSGHQPMGNEDGAIWIVHNGEIYNYLEIRTILESHGHHFKSQTDSEVILHSYEEWGVDCLRYFNGMWAFAIIDIKKRRIFCSRDRAGVKPFYYIYDGNRLCWASEIKALLQIDDIDSEPNGRVIFDYLRDGLVDHTHETFFRNIYQLGPGEYLLFENSRLLIQSYWDIKPFEIYFLHDSDYVERFYELFEDSIRLRLRTDVPIGSCLSGGIDSSSIVCLANRLMLDGKSIDPKLVGEKQKTFSSCFEDPTFDERKYIELVVNKTGTDKHYVFPKGENLLKDLTEIIWHQDEPFGSTSIYAQWRVMRLAKERGVKVLLDGQGGDELLAGYPPSFGALFKQTFKQYAFLSLVREMRGFLKHQWKNIGQLWSKLRPTQSPSDWIEDSFKKEYVHNIANPRRFENILNDHLYYIFRSLTLPGLLHYEDRNSMAHSIETRLPFLDYRLVEFVFGLPIKFKIRDGINKYVLREAMKGLIPEIVRNRMDKMGFVTPEADWLRKPLRSFIHDVLNSNSFSHRGIFNTAKVLQGFHDHCSGKMDHHSMIWRCLNLELWLRMYIDQKPSLQERNYFKN